MSKIQHGIFEREVEYFLAITSGPKTWILYGAKSLGNHLHLTTAFLIMIICSLETVYRRISISVGGREIPYTSYGRLRLVLKHWEGKFRSALSVLPSVNDVAVEDKRIKFPDTFPRISPTIPQIPLANIQRGNVARGSLKSWRHQPIDRSDMQVRYYTYAVDPPWFHLSAFSLSTTSEICPARLPAAEGKNSSSVAHVSQSSPSLFNPVIRLPQNKAACTHSWAMIPMRRPPR